MFTHFPEWLIGPDQLQPFQINEMLGMGIPALTPSTGRTDLNNVLNSTHRKDLNTVDVKVNGWPRNHPDYGARWLHNDMKEMAYLYTCGLYNKIVDNGELK